MDGRKDLDDVLRIVTSHTSTARHIATKLCRRFIDDEPPSAAIDAIATRFSRSDGSIPEVLRTLFHTEAFRSHRGSKFKQPMHLIASALRVTDAETDAGRPLLNFLTRMGHMPFEYRRMATKMPQTPGRAPSFGAGICRPTWAQANQGDKPNRSRLAKRSGGLAKLAAHILNCKPSAEELAAVEASHNPVGLLLASPGFQWS